MPVAPAGPLSTPIATVKGWLVSATSWQNWCGGSAQATAQTRLISVPAHFAFPHAIIDMAPDFNGTRDGVNIGPFIYSSGVLLYFCDNARQQGDDDAEIDFLNRVGAVMTELAQIANQGGVPPVLNGWSIAAGPARISAQERDKHGDQLEITLALDVTGWP